MASHRSKSLYAIKECSTCGRLFTKECCSIGSLKDKILVPEPDSSPRCARCGTQVDGPSCRGCAFLRKKFDEDLLTYCVENFQDTSESSNDNTNVVNALREPCVVNQDPGVKFSQEPSQIDHNCCYECGDSLDGIFCQRCIFKSCGKGAHYGYNCPPKDPIISKPEPCNQTINEIPQTLPSLDPSCYSLPHVSKPNFVDNSPNFSYPPPQLQFETYLSHLDTIPATESDEVIKSGVENLVPIPSEFEGISDDTCDVPNCNNNRVNVESELVESLINRDTSFDNSSKIDLIFEEFAGELAHIAPIPPGIVEANPNDDTSSDDDDFEDIEYVSLEEVNDEKEFDLEDIFQIQDVILREKLLNVHRLISNIESLKDNPIPIIDSDSSDISLSYSNNSLPEFESFSDDTEETRSGSTTTHANYSLSEFESFHFDPSIPRPPPEPPDIEKC
ncbi:hypothetical protein Tco_0180315 [Tanacetum coccineum]